MNFYLKTLGFNETLFVYLRIINWKKKNFLYLIKRTRKIQMKKVNTYTTVLSPMGYMGAPAAYDYGIGGTGMDKLKI